ncbi:MAG: hypothetical protein ACRES9_09240 [Gammaproteobacteria bacterium]
MSVPVRFLALITLAVGALFVVLPARAAAPPPVAAALSSLRHGSSKLAADWRYQEKITGAQGSERLGYDPTRKPEERWHVLEVNGKPPDAAARKRLAAEAAKVRKKAEHGLSVVGGGWLAASDYTLIKTTAETLVYQFRPRPAKDDHSATASLLRHLAGRFVVSRHDHRPISLRLDNFESFSPRFGLKVNAFAFRAEFKRLGKQGPVVVVRTSDSARGKVFWLKGFKNKTEVVLSDFIPVASSAPVAQTGG